MSDVISTRFAELFGQWGNDTAVCSSVTQIEAHPACALLIAMGDEIVPLVLQELGRHGCIRCFILLCAITGENPVPPEDAGRIGWMRVAWLQWGYEHGRLTPLPGKEPPRLV